MGSTLASAVRDPGSAVSRRSPASLGAVTGLWLLVLPALVIGLGNVADPHGALGSRVLAIETVLIATAQVALAATLVWRSDAMRLRTGLVAPADAGVVVAAGDVAALRFAFGAPIAPGVAPVLAYDVLLGVMLAVPVVLIVRAASLSPTPVVVNDGEASASALVSAYRDVLNRTANATWRRQPIDSLAHQLLRRHIRKTLEAIQRGYAKRAVECRPGDRQHARDRRFIDDCLLSVAPISGAVPVPTLAGVLVLSKVVLPLVGVAKALAAFGGGRWGLENALAPLANIVPDEIEAYAPHAFALVIASSLLALVLAFGIHRRDQLLKDAKICEREVWMMDDFLQVRRSSRRWEYTWTALPALPFAVYGLAALAYAIIGLFVFPSPQGPLGDLVERADVMHLGPVTGAFLSLPFLLAAAFLVAWTVDARKRTKVVRAV